MTTNGNGSPGWKAIALGVIGILVALIGWFGRGVAQDVRDLDRRTTTLEVGVAKDLEAIRMAIVDINENIKASRP